MTNLPQELFDVGKPGVKREYHFISIQGEKNSVELDFGDRLSKLKCPLDGVNIVLYSGDPHVVPECPACKNYFNGNEESVMEYIEKQFIPNTKSEIKELRKRLNSLEKILKLAENPTNEIRNTNIQNETYNKANLSEQTSKNIINMKKYSKLEQEFGFNQENVRTDGMTDK